MKLEGGSDLTGNTRQSDPHSFKGDLLIMYSCFRKISVLAVSICLYTGCDQSAQEEIVYIPDSAFLAALIANGVDQNSDKLISYTEAEGKGSLLIPPSGITDLTGLEAFIQLDSLSITLNPLEGIDLSGNRALRYLECSSCELTSLDLSNNLLLEELICNRNLLRDLDLSLNQSLVRLTCKNNLLTSLDLSANRNLIKMVSCGNQLTRLDISKHPTLTIIGVDNMPMLTEVCVWTLPFPPEGVSVIKGFSPNINFITTCNW